MAHGLFRRSLRHHSVTIFFSTGDTAADEVRRWDRSPSSEGTNKPTTVETDVEDEFIVSPLYYFTFVLFAPHHFTLSTFHHVNMCMYYVHHFTILILPYLFTNPFFHICFTIALYQSISPSHHFELFTIILKFHIN